MYDADRLLSVQLHGCALLIHQGNILPLICADER
jgi:hypothetical protein